MDDVWFDAWFQPMAMATGVVILTLAVVEVRRAVASAQRPGLLEKLELAWKPFWGAALLVYGPSPGRMQWALVLAIVGTSILMLHLIVFLRHHRSGRRRV